MREARVEEEIRRAHESANPISTRDIPHPPTAGGGCFEALMIISNINRKYCLINVTSPVKLETVRKSDGNTDTRNLQGETRGMFN